jgi:hypothetical protein
MIAVIPTNGKRPDELKTIVEHLKGFNFEKVLVVEDKGKKLYNRYIQEGESFYTQDDDCMIYNVQELIDSYDPNKIVANYKPHFQKKYDHLSGGKICLVGYGAVFSKNLANRAFQRYLGTYKEDNLMYREADRVFTWFNEKELIVGDIEDFDSAWIGMSHDDEHEDTLKEIISRLKTL